MRILNSIIIASLVTCFIACSKSENYSTSNKGFVDGGGMELKESSELDAAPPPPPAANETVLQHGDTKIIEQKLIKNGDISFEVKSIKDTKVFCKRL